MREAGILLAVSSLPSNYGIGDFGPHARTFIRKITKTGYKIWQILPINPLGFGNSPYQPLGSKPFDELYISLEDLVKEGLLPKLPAPFRSKSQKVHYDRVRAYKAPYLKRAYKKYLKDKKTGFAAWVKANEWVYNYAVFATFKKANNLVQWQYWQKDHSNWIFNKDVDLTPFAHDIDYEMWLQYIAYEQWQKLRTYAHKHGIVIMGDIPIYVGIDSIDVWENPRAFLLDEQLFPTFVGGVPGDYFNADGQLWGNPLYDWDYLAKTNYAFWIDRLAYSMKLYDFIRIDHFRAFDSYWKIPATSTKATEGEWAYPDGYKLFDAIYAALPDIKIVAEDLGDLRPEVLELRDHYNLPGMEITCFTYNPFEPRGKWPINRLVYPGTHDNSPMRGWFGPKDITFKRALRKRLREDGYSEFRSMYDNFLAMNFGSDAKYVIIMMQDMLGLDDKAKMNSPSTIGSPNWEWKMRDFSLYDKKAPFINYLIKKYKR